MYELVHCPDETTLFVSTNAAVLSWFHHSNDGISSHNTCRWLLFPFEDNQCQLSHVHPKKLMPWPCQQMDLSSFSLEPILPFQSIVLAVPPSQMRSYGPMFYPWLWRSALLLKKIAKHSIEISSRRCFVRLWANVAPIWGI